MNIVIDAESAVLGRLATLVARNTLRGHSVIVLNCSKVVITGKKDMVLRKYQTMRARGGSAMKGPFIIRSPARIVKRTVRGMLPHRTQRGISALKRVMCYNDIPIEYAQLPMEKAAREVHAPTITLEALCALL